MSETDAEFVERMKTLPRRNLTANEAADVSRLLSLADRGAVARAEGPRNDRESELVGWVVYELWDRMLLVGGRKLAEDICCTLTGRIKELEAHTQKLIALNDSFIAQEKKAVTTLGRVAANLEKVAADDEEFKLYIYICLISGIVIGTAIAYWIVIIWFI